VEKEGCGMNFETQALAVGIIKALRARAGLLAIMRPGDLTRDYCALVLRALAVTEATTWGEVDQIYEDYLQLAARYGLVPGDMN
jgi:hypothetical protein